jgi:hypothetical protein
MDFHIMQAFYHVFAQAAGGRSPADPHRSMEDNRRAHTA